MIYFKNNLREKIFKKIFLTLGFTTIVVQVILLRELLKLFSSNELTIGLFLSLWMILTGFGAYFSNSLNFKINPDKLIFIFLNLLGIIPIFEFIILIYLNKIILSTGVAFNIIQIIIITFLFLIFYCSISGILFTYLSKVLSNLLNENYIDKSYSWEATGSFFGGLIIYLFIFSFFNTFQILLINFIVIISISLFLFNQKIHKIIYSFLILIVIILIISNPDLYLRKKQYKPQELLFYKDTNYGSLSITKYYEQTLFYKNNELIFSTSNQIYNEEITHYSLSQRKRIDNILILSGFISGLLNEIIKYNPKIIDYVELDPNICRISKNFTSDSKIKVNFINSDPRRYINKVQKKYDAILINIPPPSTAGLNKYYTYEFYRSLKKIVNDSSVISFSLPSPTNYFSKDLAYLTGSIYQTLKKVFNYVIIIPTNRLFFIASDAPLTLSITDNIEKLNIKNSYVNSYYFNPIYVKERQNFILNSLPQNVKINKDFFPVSFIYQIKFWINQVYKKSKLLVYFFLLIILLIVILLFFIFLKKGIEPGMIITGFTASSFEITSILSYEIITGYIYEAITLIFSIFMSGLAIGSYIGRKINKNFLIKIKNIHIYFIIINILYLFLIHYNNKIEFLFTPLIYIFNFLMAFLTGIYFSILTSKNFSSSQDYGRIAGIVYSSDLFGSAPGAILTSLILIPFGGFYFTIITLIILNLLSLILIKK